MTKKDKYKKVAYYPGCALEGTMIDTQAAGPGDSRLFSRVLKHCFLRHLILQNWMMSLANISPAATQR